MIGEVGFEEGRVRDLVVEYVGRYGFYGLFFGYFVLWLLFFIIFWGDKVLEGILLNILVYYFGN